MHLRSSTRKRLWIAAALLAIFTLVGFFVLPPIVKSQIEKRLSAELGRRVSVEKVRMNPYALSVTLEGFLIREPDGTTSFAGWRRLYVNFDALASIRDEWVLGEIVLEGFAGRVAINPQGGFNFSDLLAKFQNLPADPNPKPARPVRIAQLRVTDARLDFSDDSRSGHFASTLGPVAFAITGFRTVSRQGAPYAFEAVTESGEKLAWGGTLQAQPLRSTGDFSFENLQLPKYAPYYADRVRAELITGQLSLGGHYELDLTPDKRVVKLSKGAMQLRALRLRERGSETDAISLPSLDVTGMEADAETLKAHIGAVSVAGGRIQVRREKDGAINLLTMLQPPQPVTAPSPAVPAPTTPPASAPLPDVSVGQFSARDLRVEITDLAAPRPAQFALNNLQVTVRDAMLKDGAEFPLQIAFGWEPHGTVSVDGSVGLRPMKLAAKAEVGSFEILPLSPYLEQFINARITQGIVNASLSVDAALPEAQPIAATLAGTVSVEKFGLVDGVHQQDLAGFASLGLHGLRVTTAPELALELEAMDLGAPYARIVVNPDKTLNLALVAASAGESAPPKDETNAAAAAPAAPLPKVEIGKITILDADYSFTDRSIEPHVAMAVNKFGGTITGLSSTNLAKADVDLKAAVDGAGPVAIAGKLDPLGAKPTVNLAVDVKNVDLTPLSPYSGKYAGFELARGKLMLDVKVLLDGRKIDLTNVITLNQFTFGNAVQSPDATSLPVRLGVALLKDTDGNIVIDVPVQGSLDDPSFKVGRVVGRVIVNLLTKAAVSPFSLLGAAFGGGGDELGFQEFVPGTAEIRPEEQRKLDTMVKALTNRPALSVDIEGSYDAAADAFALKRVKFDASVRRAIWEKKHLLDPNIAPPDQLVVSPEETGEMVKQLYDAKFPPGTEFGAPVAKAPEVVKAPPPPQGFFKRVASAITLKQIRQERAAKRENERIQAEQNQATAAAAEATGLPVEEMSARLAEATEVDANDLRGLAQARAQQVRDYFSSVGKIAQERLFLSKDQTDAGKAGKGPRVFLHLQ